MIKYALNCDLCSAEFDAWFSNSAAYEEQREQKLVSCPACGQTEISKQIMAPAVRTTGKSRPAESENPFLELSRKVRDHVEQNFEYVGSDFASEARAMHYGEKDSKPVWGETTLSEAKELVDEGVPAAPMPDEFVPKKPADPKKQN